MFFDCFLKIAEKKRKKYLIFFGKIIFIDWFLFNYQQNQGRYKKKTGKNNSSVKNGLFDPSFGRINRRSAHNRSAYSCSFWLDNDKKNQQSRNDYLRNKNDIFKHIIYLITQLIIEGIISKRNDIKKSAQKKVSLISGRVKPALEKPEMVNPTILNSGINKVTINKIMIFITQRKAPKVKKLIGVIRMFNKGLISRFKTARKTAAQKIIRKLSE